MGMYQLLKLKIRNEHRMYKTKSKLSGNSKLCMQLYEIKLVFVYICKEKDQREQTRNEILILERQNAISMHHITSNKF